MAWSSSGAATTATRAIAGGCTSSRSTWRSAASTADIRAFLHALETSPEFIVIEDVSLSEGANAGAPLSLAVQLATYYAGAPDGA